MATHTPEVARLGLLGWKLVRLIESHSDQLAGGLLGRIQGSGRCSKLVEMVPREELKQRSYEIYHNLGEWLQNKSESDVEHHYLAIGARRAAQGVPLSQAMLAIVATKEHLWEYISREILFDHSFELLQELELLQRVERFFDRASYYMAVGYESHHVPHHKAAAGSS